MTFLRRLQINFLRWNDVPRTNCNILSVLSIFKYNPGETNNKFLLYLSIISIQWCHTGEFEKKATFGRSLYSAIKLLILQIREKFHSAGLLWSLRKINDSMHLP